jgi:nucleotide-binding universal stress UspA family protein
MIYDKILLATDGSDASLPALREAVRISEDQQAILRVVFVVDESLVYHGGPGYDYISYVASCKEEGQAILNKTEALIRLHASIQFETALLKLKPFQGRIADVIHEDATEWGAALLVIGTHGRRGFSHLFMGSVAENIMRITTLPLLLVRSPHLQT